MSEGWEKESEFFSESDIVWECVGGFKIYEKFSEIEKEKIFSMENFHENYQEIY